MKTARIEIRISEQEKEELKTYCKNNKIKISSLIRDFIITLINDEKKERKE